MQSHIELKFLSGKIGHKIAYKMNKGTGPTFIWCGGLKSDMEGGKATYLHEWAAEHKRAYVRFDYYGHGQSDGVFRDGTISQWANDVVRVMDELTQGDVVLIGSSMGGWASLLAARERAERVKALLLIAPAPDFTQKLMWRNWSDEQKETLRKNGIIYVPSDYGDPYEYSQALMDDGKDLQIMDAPIHFNGPVRILQGAMDDVVPPEYSQNILDVITSQDVDFTLVKEGDHSLSTPRDLKRLIRCAEELADTLTSHAA